MSQHDTITDASITLRAINSPDLAPSGSGSVPLKLNTEKAGWIEALDNTSGEILGSQVQAVSEFLRHSSGCC